MKRLLAVLLLAGCAAQPMSYSDALGAAYATADTLARTTAELCGAPLYEGGDCVGSISTETRDRVRDLVAEALELLDESRQYQTDGSGDIALDRINRARALLATAAKLAEVKS